MKLNRKSRVFKFQTGQLAVQKSTGTKVKVVGARRVGTKRRVLLIVAVVTSTHNKGALIVAKASSFAPRPSKTASTPLVVGV
jgi:hypothetical protein